MTTCLPPELLTQHIAIVGKTGSGKTYAAKGLVERLLVDKRRVCILDPTGVWYGLRSSADGKRPGFPVAVFGGSHADVPIAEHSGAALAKVLADKNLPAIVDLSEMLIGQRHRFVTDFTEALYRDNRAPLHLVIDEADEFSPQNPLPETKRMLHHVDRIVRRGRARGFRVMLITQRPAVLHKNVLTQANTLIAMRLTAPQDRKAILAWVEGQADAAQAKAVLESLARLPRGEGWVWAPELDLLARTQFPAIATFDSSRAPSDDEVVTEPTTLAAVDLGAIKESFAEVEAEQRTVGELRAELAKAKAQLAKAASSTGVPEAEVRRRIDEAVREALIAARPAITGRMRNAIMQIRAEVDALQAELESAGAAGAPDKAAVALMASVAIRSLVSRLGGSAPAAAQRAEGVSTPEQRILDAIAWWNTAGVASPSRHQVAFVAGYTVNGHFNNQCGTLRARGLIDYPAGNCLSLSDAGRDKASGPHAAPTRDQLVQRVRDVLKGEPQRRVFMALVDAGIPLTRAELAARCSYTENGHFNNIVGALSGIGVAEYPIKGFVGLSDMFRGLS